MNTPCCHLANTPNCCCHKGPKQRGFFTKVALTGGAFLFVYWLYRLHKRHQAAGVKPDGFGAKLLLVGFLWLVMGLAIFANQDPNFNIFENIIVPAAISLLVLFS